MDFGQKYHELVGLPQAIRIDFVDEREKHRCSYCKTRQYTGCFRCPSCVRKKIDENKDALQVLDVQRQEKEARIAAYVESVKGTYQRRKKQMALDRKIKRLGHLREYVQKQRNELKKEEERLSALQGRIQMRLKTLEDTQKGSRQKWESVKARVPQVSRKISSSLKVRRETLRGVLRNTVQKLDDLYPIRIIDKNFYTIARLPLPARLYRDNLTRKSITSMRHHLKNRVVHDQILIPNRDNSEPTLDPIFAALGYVVLLCKLLSHYLATPLPFKMRFRGCHSFIEDHDDVRHGLHLPRHRSNLFADEGDQFQHVHRAIKLLDHNIRHLCLKFSLDRRRLSPLAILPNLHMLCEWLRSDNLSDSQLVTTAQDREIFHPFTSAAPSGMLLRNAEEDEERVHGVDDEDDEDDFVVVNDTRNSEYPL